MPMVVEPQSLESLSAEQLRTALLSMLQAAAAKDQELAFKQTLIDKLTHENAPVSYTHLTLPTSDLV